jgi:uncharacterized cysteine cluster protein YcgN (CxxCxxCC family)
VIAWLRERLAERRQRWESLCRQCGACCYRKEWRGAALVVNWNAPCRFLDAASRRCTVYERRFQACPDCRQMTLGHALFTTWLPDGCGYVRAFRRWPAATVRDPRPANAAPQTGLPRV